MLAERHAAEAEEGDEIPSFREGARLHDLRQKLLEVRLTPRQREFINLILNEDLEPREAAARMGITTHQGFSETMRAIWRKANPALPTEFKDLRHSEKNPRRVAVGAQNGASQPRAAKRLGGKNGATAIHREKDSDGRSIVAKRAGVAAAHQVHHVRRGVVNPNCALCQNATS